MAARAAASSTHSIAAETATQVFLAEPGDAPATAIDAVLAGVLALAAQYPAVLLSAGTILLGGTGEGLLAVDGRARQPGLEAPRPRGFQDPSAVPDAAKIAAPLLPAALMLAHAGRGTRTRTAMARLALASAAGKLDDARTESLRAFGREGGSILRAGPIREALLAAAARSVGGTLTREDLDALRADVARARTVQIEQREWALSPFDTSDNTRADGELAVVAACDTHGALAIASVLIPTFTVALPEVGLAAPLLARPVLRGVPREPTGAPLPLPAAIGVSRVTSSDSVDLALGVGGGGDIEAAFAEVSRAASNVAAALEDALVLAVERKACAVMIDSRRNGRALSK